MTDRVESLAPRRARFGLLVVCLGSVLGMLDGAVNVAFPAITRAFGLAVGDIQWIIVAFILAQSSLTIVFGKLGDLFGYWRIFRLGMAACAIAHALCALAPSFEALVALRVAQGVAVALAMACGPALATLLFPPAEQRRVLAFFVMILGVGFALGPLAGGVVLAWIGWPGVFWFRVPIALLALALSIGFAEPEMRRALHPRVDYRGAVLLAVSLSCLVLLVSVLREAAASDVVRGALLAGWALATWGFLRHEARFEQPILQLRHFRDRAFSAMQFAAVVIHCAGFSILLLVPYFLAGRGTSAEISGLTLALFPAGTVVAGAAGGWITRHASDAALVRGGMLLAAGGLLFTGYTATAGALLAWIGIALLVTGVGLGLFQVGYMAATTSALPVSDRGVAGGLVNVTRLIGYVLGASGITWLFESVGASGEGAFAFQRSFVLIGLGLLVFAGAFWTASAPPRGR